MKLSKEDRSLYAYIYKETGEKPYHLLTKKQKLDLGSCETIVRISLSSAQTNLTQWQSDYNKEKQFNDDVWQRYNDHFLALYNTDYAFIKSFEKSKKTFNEQCLFFYRRRYKKNAKSYHAGVNSAITYISYGIAIKKMLIFLNNEKSPFNKAIADIR